MLTSKASAILKVSPDLQLSVDSTSTLAESFYQNYGMASLLDGDNLYDTGHPAYGKQVAKKSIQFLHLPQILCIHL